MKWPKKLHDWLASTNGHGRVSPAEDSFIQQVYKHREMDVGFGWMQQTIEWIWQESDPRGAWGPEYFGKRIQELEKFPTRPNRLWQIGNFFFRSSLSKGRKDQIQHWIEHMTKGEFEMLKDYLEDQKTALQYYLGK